MKRDGLWFLHLSDIHVNTDEDSFFHKSAYEEFIDGLATKVLETVTTETLAGVIFTGDILYKGAVGDLPHAEKIFQHLCKRLGVQQKHVVAIHGNHDFKQTAANKDGYASAIEPVTSVFKRYGNIVTDGQTPFGSLHAIERGIFVLTVDSMLGFKRGHAGDPGNPSTPQENDIIDIVKRYVKNDDALIVASHHPLSEFNEIDHVSERIWYGGRSLAKRLVQVRTHSTGVNIWLSGDLHLPVKPRTFDSFTCILGGHLDGRPITKSLQKPAAVLFEVHRGALNGSCIEIELRQGHSRQHSGGTWWASERMKIPGEKRQAKTSSRKLLKGIKANPFKKNRTKQLTPESKLFPVERFDDYISKITDGAPTLERQIINTIDHEKLYHLGRFETAENRVSLGWVSIGPLLAGTVRSIGESSPSTPLLPLVISQMHEWLIVKIKELKIARDPSSVVLLGIDCWGAVISSQLSVMSGWRNFCIAGRGDGLHHTAFEKITPRVIREIQRAHLVVFVTDVIASGHTLHHIQEDICAKLISPRTAPPQHWIVASVLCDETTPRANELDFAEKIGCACKVLKLPLIPSASLPNEQILPPTLRFTCSKRETVPHTE